MINITLILHYFLQGGQWALQEEQEWYEKADDINWGDVDMFEILLPFLLLPISLAIIKSYREYRKEKYPLSYFFLHIIQLCWIPIAILLYFYFI